MGTKEKEIMSAVKKVQAQQQQPMQYPEADATLKRVQGLLKLVNTASISSDEDLSYWQAELVAVRRAGKQLTTTLKGYTDPLRAAEKQVRERFKPASTTLEQIDQSLTKLIESYMTARRQAQMAMEAEQKRLADIRQAAARSVEEKAASEARASSEAITAKADDEAAAAQRDAEDESRRATQLTIAAETASREGRADDATELARQAQEALQRQAEHMARSAAVRQAATDRAQQIEESAGLASMGIAVAETAAPDPVKGVSSRDSWEFTVHDVVALCKFVSENPSMADLIAPVRGEIKRLVDQYGEKTELPGVTVYPVTKLYVRT